MPGLDWLTARPVAHRGLHGNGIVENSLSAAAAAVTENYAIEVDLQLSADGEVVVFHDETLERLTSETGEVSARSAADLSKIALNGSSDAIPTLADLLHTVAGRVPLVLELKSSWNGDARLAARVADALVPYDGPVAVMSFDPALVKALRRIAPGLPRGIVAERWYRYKSWDFLSFWQRQRLGLLLHIFSTRPHFVAYAQYDLPAVAPFIVRHLLGMKLLSWTVRTEKERQRVRWWAQQIIFEFIRP